MYLLFTYHIACYWTYVILHAFEKSPSIWLQRWFHFSTVTGYDTGRTFSMTCVTNKMFRLIIYFTLKELFSQRFASIWLWTNLPNMNDRSWDKNLEKGKKKKENKWIVGQFTFNNKMRILWIAKSMGIKRHFMKKNIPVSSTGVPYMTQHVIEFMVNSYVMYFIKKYLSCVFA